MCILLDTNIVAAVFDPTHRSHRDFRPILDWILTGRGKIVYGGTTYKEEVFEKIRKFNRIFAELHRMKKVVLVPEKEVDREEARIKDLEKSADFDDAHLVAIIDVSGCLLLCSNDRRSDRYTKNPFFYLKSKAPLIYRQARHHQGLLTDQNIAPCCLPKTILNKEQKDVFVAALGDE